MNKEIKSMVSGIMVFPGDTTHRFSNLEIRTRKGQSIVSATAYYFKQKGYSRFKLRDIEIRTVAEQGVLF